MLTNHQWFQENLHVLVTLCPEKFLVIKDLSVLEFFDTHEDASKAVRLLGLKDSDYIIRKCSANSETFLTEIKLEQ